MLCSFMEEWFGTQLNDAFVAFFKESNPQLFQTLYSNHGPYQPHTSVACCYIKCIVAVSCWDEENINEAYKYVKKTARMIVKLQNSYQTFGTSLERLSLKVLEAETLMLAALMKMAVKRCLRHYLKAGICLRNSWRMFNSVQLKISEICESCGINSTSIDKLISEELAENNKMHNIASGTNGSLADDHDNDCDPTFLATFDMVEDMKAFMGNNGDCLPSISELMKLKSIALFGFGLFHLIFSLIPPAVLKIVNMFGFQGNRSLGLSSLRTVSQNKDDYRSILASLSLMWYNLALRPTFLTEPNQIAPGIRRAESIMKGLGEQFKDTWIAIYFTAVTHKLQKQNNSALDGFEELAVKCAHLKECKLIAYYEIGWCHMIAWNWNASHKMFLDLTVQARWSKGFYGYLAALTLGTEVGSDSRCREMFASLPGKIKKTVNVELDCYCSRKSAILAKTENLQYNCFISTLEMLYVWKCFHLIPKQAQTIVDTVAGRPKDLTPAALAVSHLILGLAWLQLGDSLKSEQAYKVVCSISQPINKDTYIPVCALVELSNLYTSLDRTEDSKLAAARAQSQFKNYDLQNRLYYRVKNVTNL